MSSTALSRPINPAKVSYWRIGSGSSRARFSISEASSAAASSPSCMTAQGSGSISPRSATMTPAAAKRRAPATISAVSDDPLGRTSSGRRMPCLRMVGRRSETSGSVPYRMLSGETDSLPKS
jgi:hypothetical protein